MKIKTNNPDNWGNEWKNHSTTYVAVPNNPIDLNSEIQFDFIKGDILKYLSNGRSAKIIEVGCGGARTSVYLASNGFSNLTVSDNSDEALRLASANFEKNGYMATIVNDDVLNSKIENNSFDCILSFGLLEHFENLDLLIENLTATLKPGGLHIHTVVPKKFSTMTIRNCLLYPYKFIRNIIRGNINGIFTTSFRDFPHFENSYSYKEYCHSFSHTGNEVISCEANGIIFPLICFNGVVGLWMVKYCGKPLASVIRFMDRRKGSFSHAIAPSFYIVARKLS